ncbi:MAG TPA: hypothetical protein VNO55_01885 [Polyangia bacterium]|nr:hypothetical protein [Polyangia bacterium]
MSLSPTPQALQTSRSYQSLAVQLDRAWRALADGQDDVAADELVSACRAAYSAPDEVLYQLEARMPLASHHHLMMRGYAAVIAELPASERALRLRRAVANTWPADSSIAYLLGLAEDRARG